MTEITKEEVLTYHKQGKIGIDLTKPCESQHELSLAYTSLWLAEATLEIDDYSDLDTTSAQPMLDVRRDLRRRCSLGSWRLN